MTRSRPFRFDEFRGAEASAHPAPRVYADQDLAKARSDGVIEGRRLAMETIAADEASALARIAEQLTATTAHLDEVTSRSRERWLAAARTFLQIFCERLAAAREIELADDLLRRLVENSEDRRAAGLYLNPKTLKRLRDRLVAVLEKRGVADFVTLAEDRGLKAGEARLDWRGGEVRRGRAEIAAAIAAIFDPMTERDPQE